MRQLRTMVKRSLVRCAQRLPASANWNRRVVVLCYHSIHPSKGFASADPKLFDEHLAWLHEHAEVLSFERAVAAARLGTSGRPAVAITFDDGYADNLQFALPALDRHAMTADFFLTVGLIERDARVLRRFMRERAAPLEDVDPLDWSAIREMEAAGMRFGSHTWSHPNLARVDGSTVTLELRRSKEHLEERLGHSITTIAYPYGKPRQHVTSDVVDLAAAVGYRYGAAVVFRGVSATEHPLSIPRFFVARDSVQLLESKVFGRLDSLGWWQERGPTWARRLLSPEDFSR
jgi:peptidoglycan/xylan/chitin deacetylase (PgdA/CDA1 family)